MILATAVTVFNHRSPDPYLKRQGSAGFSYTEVLVAMFLIAVLLVPAIDAMYSGIQGGDLHAAQAVQHGRLTGRMERVLTESFAVLSDEADAAGSPTVPATAYSDAAGTKDRVLVYLARYDGDDADADGDPFTGTDEDLLWVRVAIEDMPDAIESLVTR